MTLTYVPLDKMGLAFESICSGLGHSVNCSCKIKLCIGCLFPLNGITALNLTEHSGLLQSNAVFKYLYLFACNLLVASTGLQQADVVLWPPWLTSSTFIWREEGSQHPSWTWSQLPIPLAWPTHFLISPLSVWHLFSFILLRNAGKTELTRRLQGLGLVTG